MAMSAVMTGSTTRNETKVIAVKIMSIKLRKWSGVNFFVRHVGAMAWRRWSSVFQDSVKDMAPCWRMKLPNGFAFF